MKTAKKQKPERLNPPQKERSKSGSSRVTSPAPTENSNVKVYLRVKPLKAKESKSLIHLIDSKSLISEGSNVSNFIGIVKNELRNSDQKSKKTSEGFEDTAKEVIESLLDGYHCSVYNHGASKASKGDHNKGPMFQTMETLYSKLENLQVEHEVEVSVGYIQLQKNGASTPCSSSVNENKKDGKEDERVDNYCACQSVLARKTKEKLRNLFDEKAIISTEIQDLRSQKHILQCQQKMKLENDLIESCVNGESNSELKPVEMSISISQLENELNDKKSEIERCIDEIKKSGLYASLSIHISNLELTELVIEYENKIKGLEQSSEMSSHAQLTALKKEYDELNLQLAEVVKGLETLQQEYTEKEEECLKLHEQLKLVANAENQSASFSKNRVKELEEYLERSRNALASLKDQRDALNVQLGESLENLNLASAEIETLREEFARKEKECAQLEEDLKHVSTSEKNKIDHILSHQNRIKELEEALETSNDVQAQLAALKKEDDDLNVQLSDSLKHINDLSSELEAVREECARKEEECQELHEQLRLMSEVEENKDHIPNCVLVQGTLDEPCELAQDTVDEPYELGQETVDEPSELKRENVTPSEMEDESNHLITGYNYDSDVSAQGTEDSEGHENSSPSLADSPDWVPPKKKLRPRNTPTPLPTTSWTPMTESTATHSKARQKAQGKKKRPIRMSSRSRLRSTPCQGQYLSTKRPLKESNKEVVAASSALDDVRTEPVQGLKKPRGSYKKPFNTQNNPEKGGKRFISEQQLMCSVDRCKMAFSSPVELKKHIKIHDRELLFKCLVRGCDKAFSRLRQLQLHNRSHFRKKEFKCTVKGCSKKFATIGDLEKHFRIHTGERPYKCIVSGCDRAFAEVGNLNKHVLTHTGEHRKFKCPFDGCTSAFASSNALRRHIRFHTGEKPFICPERGCAKAFFSANDLKRHSLFHSGERPFKCAVKGCKKTFTQGYHLQSHMKQHYNK